jgi:hypothetical protein
MNARTIATIGLIAIMGIGAIMLLADFLSPKAPPARVQVALAAQQIQPGQVITQDMLRSTEMTEKEALSVGAWRFEDAVGKMSMSVIAPNTKITGVNAKPIADVRFSEDLGLEVVTFAATVDRSVGGKLRPGNIINLYGNGKSKDNEAITVLIESQLQVVAVSASGRSVTNATPRPNIDTGELVVENAEDDQPASMLTVATTPNKVFNIIDALGSRDLTPWVTLAASQTASGALATPVMATATPGLPLNLSLTATAIWEKLRMTQAPPVPGTGDGGSR